jgi:hypothetical protein
MCTQIAIIDATTTARATVAVRDASRTDVCPTATGTA